MNKEDLIVQVNKIYQALNTISVQGYGSVKTLGNCLDAMQELAKNINSYEKDIQEMIKKQIETYANDCVVPVNPDKPKPERVTKEVNDIAKG